ncbi:MAG TPA: hypothetical protein VK422_09045 [Pyrinomonadaceae bacterium]|nr:hypothetical protein [Pyrinomonadaceae bacterium]
MSRSIFLIQGDNSLVKMKEHAYDSEDILQNLLASYPDLLPGEQMNPDRPRKWLLVKREAAVPAEEEGAGRWAVDHLFLDQDAVPTIVEVKRSSDTRIRREVVGQMLDYAANGVLYWSAETLRAQFEASCREKGADADGAVSNFLGVEGDAEAFWQNVKTNLQAGKVRLVFVADIIPRELKRIVEFLNEQMDPAEVLAVEIKQYVGEGLKTLVPSVLGLTAEAQQRKSSAPVSKRQWDETLFFEELEKKSIEDANVARKILDWARPKCTRIWWGKGQQTGSFVPILEHNGIHYQLFTVLTSGFVEFYFGTYQRKRPFDDVAKRLELLRRLNSIEGINIPDDKISLSPNIRLSMVRHEAALRQFLKVFEWFTDEVKAT